MVRTVAAFLLIGLALVASLPPQVIPWTSALRAAFTASWPAWTVVVALVLALAGRLLPAQASRPARHDHSGLTVGLLLLMEPLLHIAILALSIPIPTAVGAEALLPALWVPARSLPQFLQGILIYAVLVPICEEYCFRGRLLPWLRERVGGISAVTISTLAFAAGHGDVAQMVVALPVGLLLGTMRLAGADLGACMLAHAVHNGLFLITGPGLIDLPVAAPLLFGAGALLAAFAWYFHLRPQPAQWRRFVLCVLGSATLAVAIAPGWRRAVDVIWVGGAHRVLVLWRISNRDLLTRLVASERSGRLTPLRRERLLTALVAKPCQTTPRQTGLLALLDPVHARDLPTWEDDSYELCAELAEGRPVSILESDVARRFAVMFPEAVVDALFEHPEVLSRWLPLPERMDEAAALLTACQSPRDRTVLLTALEREFPGLVSQVVAAMPPNRVGPIEIRHLRRYYGTDGTVAAP